MADPREFDLQIEPGGEGTRIVLKGDVDIAAVPELESARERALGQRPERLLIDLRQVDFVDSSGLKFLLETHRLAQQDGWELALTRPTERAMKVFEVTGAERHLPFLGAEE